MKPDFSPHWQIAAQKKPLDEAEQMIVASVLAVI